MPPAVSPRRESLPRAGAPAGHSRLRRSRLPVVRHAWGLADAAQVSGESPFTGTPATAAGECRRLRSRGRSVHYVYPSPPVPACQLRERPLCCPRQQTTGRSRAGARREVPCEVPGARCPQASREPRAEGTVCLPAGVRTAGHEITWHRGTQPQLCPPESDPRAPGQTRRRPLELLWGTVCTDSRRTVIAPAPAPPRQSSPGPLPQERRAWALGPQLLPRKGGREEGAAEGTV